MRFSATHQIIIGCGAVVLILGLLGQIAYRAANTAGESSELIARAQSVLLYSENISVQLDRLDLRIREIADSETPDFGNDYQTALSALIENRDLLEFYASPDSPHLSHFAQIRELLEAKRRVLDQFVAALPTFDGSVDAQLAASEALTSELHEEIRQLQRVELADLANATFADQSAAARTRYSILLVSVGGVVFLIIGASFMIGDLRRRTQTPPGSHSGEQLFRTLADSAPIGILLTGPNGEVEFLNDYYTSIAGVTEDQLRGRPWTESLQRDDSKAVSAEWEQAVAGGGNFEAEYRSASPEGRVAWIHGRFAPLRGEDGLLAGFIGTATDMTERKRAENERRRFFDLSQDLLSTSDFGGTLLRVNPAWSDRLGFNPTELTGTKLLDLVHADDQDATTKVWGRLMVGGSVTRFQNRVRTKDGLYRRLSWNAAADMGERLVYAIARDITDSGPVKEQRTALAARSGPDSPQPGDSPRGLLVIEHNAATASRIVEMLAHNGIRAQTTGTATEAIETATATKFDAIILDLHLPDMDGREVLDMIRRSGCNRKTPIVAILSASDRASIPDLHIQGFVEHPVDLHHLGDALWRAGLAHTATPETA